MLFGLVPPLLFPVRMATQSPDSRRQGLPTGRILVIAEEFEVVDAVTEYFADLDYEAHGAIAVEDAVALVDRSTPDVILLDVQMPRLTDVLTQLRGRCANIPIVVATDSADSARRLRSLGAFACVYKPFVWDVLRHRIAIAVDATLRARSHRHSG